MHGFFNFLLLCALIHGFYFVLEVFLNRQGQTAYVHASPGALPARRAAHICQKKMQEEGAGVEGVVAGQCGCIIGMSLAWMQT